MAGDETLEEIRDVQQLAFWIDGVGGGLFNVACRGNERIEPAERALDQLQRPIGRRIVRRNRPPDRLERLRNDGKRSLERVSALFSSLSDRILRCDECGNQRIEVA